MTFCVILGAKLDPLFGKDRNKSFSETVGADLQSATQENFYKNVPFEAERNYVAKRHQRLREESSAQAHIISKPGKYSKPTNTNLSISRMPYQPE